MLFLQCENGVFVVCRNLAHVVSTGVCEPHLCAYQGRLVVGARRLLLRGDCRRLVPRVGDHHQVRTLVRSFDPRDRDRNGIWCVSLDCIPAHAN